MINASGNMVGRMQFPGGYGFDTAGLKFLFDPARILGMDSGLTLGSNLVTNGDFHDFTMENDANVKGHWIFDSYYDSQEGGSGFVGQNWSAGAPSLGSELCTNNSFENLDDGTPDDGEGDDFTDWVESTAANVQQVSDIERDGYVVKVIDNAVNIRQTITIDPTKPIIVTGYTKGDGTNRPKLRLRDLTGGIDLFLGDIASATGWQYFEKIVHFTTANTSLLLYLYPASVADAYAYFDDISVKQPSGTNNVVPSNGYEDTGLSDFLTGSSPVYEDGNVMAFNGIDQYFSIPSAYADDFDPGTGDFSIEAWIKIPSTASATGEIYQKVVNTSGYVRFFVVSASTLRFDVYDGSNIGVLLAPSGGLNDDAWHHVAAVFDRDVGAYLYIDGVEVIKEETAEWTVIGDCTTGVMNIGNRSTNYFTGQIAEVRYSNVARTSAEVRQSYGLAKGWDAVNDPTGLIESRILGEQCWDEKSGESNGQISQTVTVESGELYRCEFEMKVGATANTSFVFNNISLRNVVSTTNTDWQTFVYYHKPNSTVGDPHFYTFTSTNVFVRNVKVQKVTASDNYMFFGQGSTTTDAGGVEDFSLGGGRWSSTNKATNGTFDTDTGWTKQTGWTISGGTANCDGSQTGSSFVFQNMSIERWKTYKVSFDITSYTAGNAFAHIGGYQNGRHIAAIGHYETILTANSASGTTVNAGVGGDLNFVGSIDNVVVQELENGYHGGTQNSLEDNQPAHPSGFEFDGVADYISFGDNLDLRTYDAIITAWIKVPDGTPASIQYLWTKYETGSNYWYSRLEVDGDFRFYSTDSVGGDSIVFDTTDGGLIPDDTWTHVAFVLDRDGSGHVFINGVEKTVTTTTMNNNDQENTGDLLTGKLDTIYTEMIIGLSTIHLYDGADGAPSALPSNYADIISAIYNWSLGNRKGYGTER